MSLPVFVVIGRKGYHCVLELNGREVGYEAPYSPIGSAYVSCSLQKNSKRLFNVIPEDHYLTERLAKLLLIFRQVSCPAHALSPTVYQKLVIACLQGVVTNRSPLLATLGRRSAALAATARATPARAVRGLQRPAPVWSSPANRRPTNMQFHSPAPQN